MRLSEILAAFPRLFTVSKAECEIDGITEDSRLADAHKIFVARPGKKLDGRDFIADAARRGCRVVLSRSLLPVPKNVTVILSENEVKSMAEIAYFLAGSPEKKLDFIGVTGTKGKSMTAEFLRASLSSLGIPTFSVGTPGVRGLDAPPQENTTPPSPVLADIFARAVGAGKRAAILEISSQALADDRVFGIPVSIGVFTSFGVDHVGRLEHASLSDYFDAKHKLFKLPSLRYTAANGDDPVWRTITSGSSLVRTAGFSPRADLSISHFESDLSGSRFLLSDCSFFIPYPGEFFVRDAALAVLAALLYTGEASKKLLPLLKAPLAGVSLPGRFERFFLRDRLVVIDFAHNAMSLRAVLTEARSLAAGHRVFAVFGSVGGRGEVRRKTLAAVASELADFSVITSDDPDFEDPLAIAREIFDAFPEKARAAVVPDRAEAIRFSFRKTAPGDVLLLLGKGDEAFQKTRGERVPFSEKNILAVLDKDGGV